MNTKQTLGPWRVSHSTDGFRVFVHTGPDAHCLGTIQGHYKYREDHARLIAAAPELLEALNRLVSHCTANNGTPCKPSWYVVEEARAAIAKAEGHESSSNAEGSL